MWLLLAWCENTKKFDDGIGRVFSFLFTISKDKLFFSLLAKTNSQNVPAMALIAQCGWDCILVLPDGTYEGGSDVRADDTSIGY